MEIWASFVAYLTSPIFMGKVLDGSNPPQLRTNERVSGFQFFSLSLSTLRDDEILSFLEYKMSSKANFSPPPLFPRLRPIFIFLILVKLNNFDDFSD